LIIFKSISWRNFLSTGNVPTEIILNEHSHSLIVGKNGSGKSTLLDAIDFGLFGRPFRNINKPNLVNSLNDKDCEVTVNFTIGKTDYRVCRGIKPDFFEIYKNGKLIPQDASARDYQANFEQTVLKFTHKSFNQIVILGSASHTPFMQLDAFKRREVIEEILNIRIFSQMQTLLKKKINAVDSEMGLVANDLTLIEEKVRLALSYIQKNQEEQDQKEKETTSKIDEYESSIKDFNKIIDEYSSEVDKYKLLINELNPNTLERQELIDQEKKLMSSVKALEKQINFFDENSSCPTCSQVISDKLKKQMVESNDEKVTEYKSSIKDLIKTKERVDDKIALLNQYTSKVSNVVNDISRYNREISILKGRIETIKEHNNKNYTSIIADEQERIKGHRNEHVSLIQKKKALMTEARINAIAQEMLKDTGIKTLIIKQYIPVINTLINKYLAAMDFFVNFTLDETFSESIRSRYRDKFSYDNFSEGEKQKIDLALIFTWRDISRLNNSISTNLLIMDEIFDSSLDTNATEELSKILFDLGKEVNLFVISHKTDILPDKFKNVIRFEKIKNYSRMM
jgi:DNA repair exonuclease SbcCD ATPase subunit